MKPIWTTSECANCRKPIRGELTGNTGFYSWRHADGDFATFGCDRRVDRFAPQAIPASEATAWCPVHKHVTGYHFPCDAAQSEGLARAAGQ
jgi:hypothetical protein